MSGQSTAKLVAALDAAPRLATIASGGRFVTHVAVGGRTRCGKQLAGTRVVAPGPVVAKPCEHCSA